jgi:hypothetical protein
VGQEDVQPTLASRAADVHIVVANAAIFGFFIWMWRSVGRV